MYILSKNPLLVSLLPLISEHVRIIQGGARGQGTASVLWVAIAQGTEPSTGTLTLVSPRNTSHWAPLSQRPEHLRGWMKEESSTLFALTGLCAMLEIFSTHKRRKN